MGSNGEIMADKGWHKELMVAYDDDCESKSQKKTSQIINLEVKGNSYN